MATGLRVQEITIPPDGGRDAGKTYILTELPAEQAEKWAVKVWLALARSGSTFKVSEDEIQSGLAGVASALLRQGINLFAHMRFEDAEPLMDEMFSCIQVRDKTDKGKVNPRRLYPVDIQEWQTRLLLRKEVLALHVDFSATAAKLRSILATVMKTT